ncbi:MAG TPA: rhamnulokinase [Kofleriaceae bacterium]|nr:rhamnulokinase [Kofleriaceae bacterium]
MTSISCVAVDLGASSGRVVLVELVRERLSLREARRFETPRQRDADSGYECWDLAAIESEVRAGIATAAAMAPAPVASVGVDGWAVDHVLLDGEGHPVAPAVCYRDGRTRGVMEEVFTRIPAREIYRRTGIQFQPFNTLYQLAATARQQPSWLARARRLLMLPDYLHFRLGGEMASEYTNATTTQLWGLATGDWDDELLAAAGISRDLMARPIEPGTIIGETAPPGGGPGLCIAAPATHDTASAVAAIPLAGADEAFISSGTWSLMGVESERPLVDDAARQANFTSEGGVGRRFRVLKNIAGLWLLQRIGEERGHRDAAALVSAALGAPPWRSVIDPDDPRFLNPDSMVGAMVGFCRETGQPAPADDGELARCALESLALSYRRVKGELEAALGHPLVRIHIGGGGGRNELLDQLAADACQVPVIVGPAEVSVLGNACVQLIALGELSSLRDARALIRRSFAPQLVEPRAQVPEAAWRRFQALPRPPSRGSPSS